GGGDTGRGTFGLRGRGGAVTARLFRSAWRRRRGVLTLHPMMLPRWIAPALAAGLLAIAVDANAGTLTMRDDAQVFSPGDADRLRAVVAQAPFDARLVTTTVYADQAGLSRFVGQLVSEPDMVVVGIDPTHRHVQVHFGTGSRIPEAQWPVIERAGNDAFKRGAWEEGGGDIFRAASGAAGGPG